MLTKEEIKNSCIELSIIPDEKTFEKIIKAAIKLGCTRKQWGYWKNKSTFKYLLFESKSNPFDGMVFSTEMLGKNLIQISDILGEEQFQFEKDNWYKVNFPEPDGLFYCKFLRQEKDTIWVSNQIRVNDKIYSEISDLAFDVLSKGNVYTLATLEEIQQYLPANHPDLIQKEFVLPKRWVIRQNTSQEVCDWYNKKFNLRSYLSGNYAFLSSIGQYYNNIPKDFTEITLDQFKQFVLKTPIVEEVKLIEKWSVGSYVVFLEDYVGNNNYRKGNYQEIVRFDPLRFSGCITYKKGSENDIAWEERGKIKWFPTLEEAEIFSKSLLEPTMEDLLKEAKLRYPVGTKYNSALDNYPGGIVTTIEWNNGNIGSGSKWIYNKTTKKWAEIVSTPEVNDLQSCFKQTIQESSPVKKEEKRVELISFDEEDIVLSTNNRVSISNKQLIIND